MQNSMVWWNGKTVQGRWRLWKSGGVVIQGLLKEFPHIPAKTIWVGRRLPPCPRFQRHYRCRCLVVGRLEGSRTKKKGKGNLNNRLGLWKQQLAVSISVSSMHRVVFMHTACSLNTSAAAPPWRPPPPCTPPRPPRRGGKAGEGNCRKLSH